LERCWSPRAPTNPITIREGPWHMQKDVRQQLKRAMQRCEIEENA